MNLEELAKKAPAFEGSVVKLGGVALTCPPLTLKQLRAASPALQELRKKREQGGVTIAETCDVIGPIVLSALRRNYPELDLDTLEEHCDLVQWNIFQEVVMGQAGYRTALPGEPKPVAK